MPTEVILAQLDTVLPLLMQSIDLPDPNVKLATLQVLMVTLTESPKTLEGHVAGLMNRLVKCASLSGPAGLGEGDQRQSNPAVRTFFLFLSTTLNSSPVLSNFPKHNPLSSRS